MKSEIIKKGRNRAFSENELETIEAYRNLANEEQEEKEKEENKIKHEKKVERDHERKGYNNFKLKINYKKLIEELISSKLSLETVYLNHCICIDYHDVKADRYYDNSSVDYLAPVKTKIYCKKDFDLSKKYSMEELKDASEANEIFFTSKFTSIDIENKIQESKIDTERKFSLGSVKYDPKNLLEPEYYYDQVNYRESYNDNDELVRNFPYDKDFVLDYEPEFGKEEDGEEEDDGVLNFKNYLIISDSMNDDNKNIGAIIAKFADCKPNARKIIRDEIVRALDNEINPLKNNARKDNEQER